MANELQIVNNTIADITSMVEDSVRFQKQVSPIYSRITTAILGMLDNESELSRWEAKDLVKLLDLSNKAQLAPVEQLTKLIQSVQSLYERTELQEKIDKLSDVVNEINDSRKNGDNVVGQENTTIEDIEATLFDE